MKMKKSTKFQDKNKRHGRRTLLLAILFILFCLCGAAYSINLFWQNLNSALYKDESPVATVTFKYKTAQRKFEGRMIWNRLRQKSPIYNEDTIRTAAGSEATIYFDDGTKINVGENTMLLISIKNGKIQALLQEGTVTMDSTESKNGGEIISGNKRTEIKAGASGSVILSEDGGTKIQSSMGKVDVFDLTAPENSQELFEGSGLYFDKNQNQKKIPIITVTSPHANEKILNFDESAVKISFVWQTQDFAEGDYPVLQISSNREFTKIEEEASLEGLTSLEKSLGNGNHYWRIFPKNAGDDFSAQSKISIFDTSDIKALVPNEESYYAYKNEIPDVRFVWNGNEWADGYELEVSTSPDMANPIIRQQTTTSSSIINTLKDGVYFWKVTPIYSINNHGFGKPSEIQKFTIIRYSETVPTSPILPTSGSLISVGKDGDVGFSWTADAEASHYNIKIARDKEMTDLAVDEKTTENYFIAKSEAETKEGAEQAETGHPRLTDGHWYWTVTKFDKAGGAATVSDVLEFDLQSEERIKFFIKNSYPPKVYGTTKAQLADLHFDWDTNVSAKTAIEFARNEDFTDIVYSAGGEKSCSGVNLDEGIYYWRVRSDGSSNKVFSDSRILNVRPKLKAPELKSPSMYSILAPEAGEKTTFSWGKLPGADYYNFTLRQKGSEKILASATTAGTSTRVDLSSYPEGDFEWQVQAIEEEKVDSTARKSEEAKGDFTVDILKNVLLSYPESGAKIDGIKAIEKPGTVRWKEIEKAYNVKFTLSKSPDGRSDPLMSVRNPKNEIQLDQLKPGRYYWTVTATNKNGFDISAQEVRTFTILPVPDLPQVKQVSPLNYEKFNAEKIRKSRKILFKWQPVKNAADYSFTLRDKNGEILKTLTGNFTAFELEDMASLGNGTYTWSVQARRKIDDGTIVARSPVVSGEFTINLPRAKDIIIDDTGTLYGN